MGENQRHVAVIGATGGVGRELCARYAAAGVRVHAIGRDARRLADLEAHTGAATYRVDLNDDAAAQRVAERLAEHPVGLAVACIGGWYVAERGLDLPMSRWRDTIESNLTAHFVAARRFAPALRGDRPAYLALNGIASHYPCEGSLAISVAGVGQRMMLDILAAEGRADDLRYAELVIDTPVVLPGDAATYDEPTHDIAEVYDAIESLAGERPAGGTVARRHLG